jgi:alpha-galactosidase
MIYTLHGKTSSYCIETAKTGFPLAFHWGGAVADPVSVEAQGQVERSFFVHSDPGHTVQPELLPLECIWSGEGDFRSSMVELTSGAVPLTGFRTASVSTDPFPSPEGLPGFRHRADDQYLTLSLEDSFSRVILGLHYAMAGEYDAVIRSLSITNNSDRDIIIHKALSALVSLPEASRDLLYLTGAWARERSPRRIRLDKGLFSFGSMRGESGHHFSPVSAILSPESDEVSGSAYGFSLLYSGNFLFQAETDQDNRLTASMGIHPDHFAWTLPSGGRFETPEVVLVYANDGLGGLSRRFHHFTCDRVIHPRWAKKERPVLLNNWEATYFDFDQQKLERIVDASFGLGIELFVLDDGWFGKRNDDTGSLGDWQVNAEKLPGGVEAIAKRAHDKGMLFGLWFEPEMISRDSDLFRAHPDWCLHIPGRELPEGRNQLVLDLCRRDVREYIYTAVANILDKGCIDYVKWDMNRSIAPLYSPFFPDEPMGNCAFRYQKGVYELMGRLTEAYPDILFEGCSGGGGRFDLGMLYYMPQYWTSDNTDAVERAVIQEGTSIFFPQITMGAHVSAVPNHQTGRKTPLSMRYTLAAAGNLGYELDPLALSETEKTAVKEQIAFYRKHRILVQTGQFYRLNPSREGEKAWLIVSPDRSSFMLYRIRLTGGANEGPSLLRLRGLDPEKHYREHSTDLLYGGDQLMERGLYYQFNSGERGAFLSFFSAAIEGEVS